MNNLIKTIKFKMYTFKVRRHINQSVKNNLKMLYFKISMMKTIGYPENNEEYDILVNEVNDVHDIVNNLLKSTTSYIDTYKECTTTHKETKNK